jgi:hypothetical protein
MARNTDAPESVPATMDAYTGMLAIALLALIVGCVLLYLDFSQYPEKTPTPPKYAEPAVPAGGPPMAVPPPKAPAPAAPDEKKDEAK